MNLVGDLLKYKYYFVNDVIIVVVPLFGIYIMHVYYAVHIW